jgi:hypothetical protein
LPISQILLNYRYVDGIAILQFYGYKSYITRIFETSRVPLSWEVVEQVVFRYPSVAPNFELF